MTGKPSVKLKYHPVCHLIQSFSKLPEHEDTFFFSCSFFIFNWGIVALPCLAGFCCTTRISYKYAYICILPCLSLSLEPPNPPIPQFRLSPSWAPSVTQPLTTSYLFYRWTIHTWKDAQRHSVLEKGKSKLQGGITSHQSEWSSSKNLQAINAGEDVEKRKPSCIAGGNVNWYLRTFLRKSPHVYIS